MPQYVFKESNADYDKAWQRLWNDPELTAKDETKGRLPLKPRNVKAKIFLSHKGVFEVFCQKYELDKVITLLQRKIPTLDGQPLSLTLQKTILAYSWSFGFFNVNLNLKIPYAATLIQLIKALLVIPAFTTLFMFEFICNYKLFGTFGAVVVAAVLTNIVWSSFESKFGNLACLSEELTECL